MCKCDDALISMHWIFNEHKLFFILLNYEGVTNMSRKIHRILLALVVVIMGSCFLLSEKDANAYTTKAQIRKSIKKYTYLEKKVKKEAISAKKVIRNIVNNLEKHETEAL